MAYLLITHNVAAVRFVADRVAVMYLGKIAEVGPVRQLLEHPLHPYTKALLAALPVPDPARRRTRFRLKGDVPTLIRPPPGCRFASRCPFVIDRCKTEEPILRTLAGEPGHFAACHRAEELRDVPPEALIGPSTPQVAPSPNGT
jgi:oligopeptide/dipeptide ABC transporter ATP-binding protein